MKRSWKYIIFGFIAFSTLLVIAKSIYYTLENGGVDLRHQIVAARLLATNHSPYFYKPVPADGDRFLEGHSSVHRAVNGTTVTPGMLYLMYPLAQLPYQSIRISWLFIQFLLLAMTLIFLGERSAEGKIDWLPILFVVMGLVCSDVWLLHVERGQVYIFYVWLMALSYWLFKKARTRSIFLSGAVIGLSVFIRPLFLIFLLPFLVRRVKFWIYGCFAGLVLGLCLFVIPRPSLWKEYAGAMQSFAENYTLEESQTTSPVVFNSGTIEGMNNLQRYSDFNTGNLKIFHNYMRILGMRIGLVSSLAVYAALVFFLMFLFSKRIPAVDSREELFLICSLLYILAELFILAPRASYCVVEWIVPLFLICRRNRENIPVLLFVAFGLLFIHSFPFKFPRLPALGEAILLSTLVYTIYSKPIVPDLAAKT